MRAKRLGERPGKWAALTFVVWVTLNIAGVVLYSNVSGVDLLNIEEFEKNTFIAVTGSFFGILCGYLGYLLLKKKLESLSEK